MRSRCFVPRPMACHAHISMVYPSTRLVCSVRVFIQSLWSSMRRQPTPRWRWVESAPFSPLPACLAFGLSRGLNELPRSSSFSSCTISDETEMNYQDRLGTNTQGKLKKETGPFFTPSSGRLSEAQAAWVQYGPEAYPARARPLVPLCRRARGGRLAGHAQLIQPQRCGGAATVQV